MIKNIETNKEFLSIPSKEATLEDLRVGQDLKDTLIYERSRCIGMAANMIGVSKRIIAIVDQETDKIIVMYNPMIIRKEFMYTAKEGCLCHKGEKEVVRYQKIAIKYYDEHFKIKIKTYEGLNAEIIEHELDHLEGFLV